MPKRKSSGFTRATKRLKRTKRSAGKKRKRSKLGASVGAVIRPRRFYNLAPRIKTTHVNKISSLIVVTGTLLSEYMANFSLQFKLNRLRDPFWSTSAQCFPENFVSMARMYSRYRVYGCTVWVSFYGLSGNENRKFYALAYHTSSSDGSTDPYDPTTVSTLVQRNAMLQNPEIRKKMISGAATQQDRKDNVFKVGYYSIPAMEEIKPGDMTDDLYAGTVTETGGNVSDPSRMPNLFINLCTPSGIVWPNADFTYEVEVTLKFHCEWFDRRESQEASIILPTAS